MPIDKNTLMKIKNSQDEWIYLYPKTKMEQVDGLSTEINSIKDKLNELSYVSPTILTFAPNGALAYEKGTTISSLKFSWSYNKTITTQTFESTSLDVTLREYTYTTSFNANKTFTLSCSDGKNSASKNCSISFSNGRYHGVSNSLTYDNNFIKSLTKTLTETRANTFTVNCGADQFIYFSIPTRLGTPSFTVNGFSGGFSKVTTINFTNASNYTESYDIWKSTNKNLGQTTVIVS